MDDSGNQMLMTPLDGEGMIVEVEQCSNSDIEEMIYGLSVCLDWIYAWETTVSIMRED